MNDSSFFDSFIPVYDVVPEKWDDAREFLVEHLKKISNGVNNRESGLFVDTEVLAGKRFIPGAMDTSGGTPQFRTVLRKVVNVGPLIMGVNPGKPHGITIDINFTLIDLWVAATNSSALTSQVITDSNLTLSATNIIITSPAAFDRAFCVIEYIQEL